MFNLDISKIIVWCLPVYLRKQKIFAFLSSLCEPLGIIYTEFMTIRNKVIDSLKYDGKVYKLEMLLNNVFDNEERRIELVDGLTKDRIFIHTKIENKPVYIENEIVYTEIEYGDSGEDFIVRAPALFTTNEVTVTLIKSLVNKYKLASKRFKIQTI